MFCALTPKKGCFQLVAISVPFASQISSHKMVSFKIFLLIYFFGGITLVPIGVGIALFLIWLYHQYLPEVFHSKDSNKEVLLSEKEGYVENSQSSNRHYRSGWLRIRTEYEPGDSVSSIMSGIQSYVSGKSVSKRREKYFAVLKFGTLFLFDNESKEDCRMVVPVHNYKASIYPENLLDHEVYAKPNAIKLSLIDKKVDDDHMTLQSAPAAGRRSSSNEEEDISLENTLYVFCDRPVDKEDWFFAFMDANDAMEMDTTNPFVEYVDKTRLDQIALNQLIKTVQEDSSHRHAQWLNAILGRIFLAVYKTDRINELIYHKVSKKARKVKRPGFLGEISVQNVQPGHSLPYITRPKLLSLGQNGELQAQANIHYAGSFRLEIATDIAWSYSSKMKPIKVHVELAVMLKKLTGKVLVKIKPPPSNRLWIGFYEPPQMDWIIEPIVSDKPIKLSMVTNAIESKIREFMVENMVLPNMDDFPFFETDGLGGIFGEKVEKVRRSKSQEAAEATEVSNNVEKIAQDLQAESSSATASSLFDEDDRSVLLGDEPSLRNRHRSNAAEDASIASNRKLKTRSATDKDFLHSKDPLLGTNLLNDRSISKSTPNLLGGQTSLVGHTSLSQESHPGSSDTASIKSFESLESEDDMKEPAQENDASKRWSNTIAKLKKSIGKDSDAGSTKEDKPTRNLSDSDSIEASNKPRSRSSTLSSSDGKNRNSFISRMNGYIEQKLNDENETSTIGSNDGASKRAALRAKATTFFSKGIENMQDYRERNQDNKSVQLLEKFGGKGRLRSISSASDRPSSVSSSELPPISPSKPPRQHIDSSGTAHVPQSPTKPIASSKDHQRPQNPTAVPVEHKPALSPAQQYKQFVYDTLEKRDDVPADQSAIQGKPESVKEVQPTEDFSNHISQSSFVPSELKHAHTVPVQKPRPVPPPPVPPRNLDAPASKITNNEAQVQEANPEPTNQALPKKPEKPPVPPRSSEVQKRLTKPVLPPRDLPN
ncbi:hypothetical protein INT43_004334 [Umbelopsis isabellina]|uniref:SMP-LTD domain-containing protein n=1 Tax=Mortierella isabellina TaxID=91625 RepID=A0A8H7PI22_MORIS|nr:hypothetical protein INT43_004334 [Umbelopsis isabellina]